MTRIVEAYVGEYASGKSECAVNRAIELLNCNSAVTLVDLDLVEPCYTLRPIREELNALGMEVISWVTSETVGLGETGGLVKPAMRWVLRRPGNIVLDIGYGVKGAKVLNLIEGAWEDPDLQIYAVLNLGRPCTSTLEEIVDYVKSLGPIHALINNSHLGAETDLEFIQDGAKIVNQAAKTLGIPMLATTADERFRVRLGARDCVGKPVRYLTRYMPRTLW